MPWEYRTDVIRLKKKGGLGPKGAGGAEPEEISALLNKLGADDWELVSAVDTHDLQGPSAGLLLLSKRPKPR